MSLIKCCHESMRFICLFFISLTHSFNYLSYIPFLIIFIKQIKDIRMDKILYLMIYYIIYDVIKYFSISVTIKMNKLIGEYFYYSLSICIMSIINLVFSFVAFSNNNIFIFISHRILISIFNNISSNIDLILNLFYSQKTIFRKKNFSFYQKITNFLFFLIFLLFYNFLKNFYIYCFILSIFNLISFIFSLIVISCHKENIYNQYIPNISEKENDGNFIKTYKIKENKKEKNRTKEKTKNNTNEIVVENNSISNNVSTGVNNINFFSPNKDKDKKNNLILHESIKEINPNESKNNNSLRRIVLPLLFQDKNKNFLYAKNIRKIMLCLLLVSILSRVLNYLSIYMLIFKFSELKFISIYSGFYKKISLEEDYLFLFASYYLLSILLYLINMLYTSIALKKKIINYIFYYISLIILLLSSIFFIYNYLKKFEAKKINKNIIIYFLNNLLMNECIMLMSVFFNIIGNKKRLSEKILKDIKITSLFLASIIFIIIQGSSTIINAKIKYNIEKIFYYSIFSCFILIIFFISVVFLN